MLETLTEELELPAKSFGSTTLNREDLERGAEPDSCYYIQHVGQIAGRHVDLATDLGVDLQRGIPVAIVFGPDGNVIGTTNAGQLEPARFYTSKQILKFVRDIVEKSLIAAPDSVR